QLDMKSYQRHFYDASKTPASPASMSMTDQLLCLPLEEIITEDFVWRDVFEVPYMLPKCGFDTSSCSNGPNFYSTDVCDFDENRCVAGSPDVTASEFCNNYFDCSSPPDLGAHAYTIKKSFNTNPDLDWKSSFNPALAFRSNFQRFCRFSPPMEFNAAQWGGRENADLSDFPGRRFLPDTLRKISITRGRDGDLMQPYTGGPAISGPLPSEWSLFSNLEYLNLSDAMGQGSLVGGIPMSWYLGDHKLTKLKLIDVRGHPNFCRDWHRHNLWRAWYANHSAEHGNDRNKLLFDYFGDKLFKWTDDNGNSGRTEVLSDGKCCYGYDTALVANTSAADPHGLYNLCDVQPPPPAPPPTPPSPVPPPQNPSPPFSPPLPPRK
ncbi:hypothetical protein DUNSADRAFT_18372, partial [Dunaliella salina]